MINQENILNSSNGTHFIYVAPSNSTYKEIADYVCDGNNDSQQINAAISAAKAGTEIILLNGKFNIKEKINVNKANLTIRGSGYSTVMEQVALEGGKTSIIFDISADDVKIKDMMVVDVDVSHPEYIIRTYGEVYDCQFERLFLILKSTVTNTDAYIDLAGRGIKFINCRVYSYTSVPSKKTINIVGNSPIISGMLNTGNDTIRLNFSNNTYYAYANDRTEIYVNGVKQ